MELLKTYRKLTTALSRFWHREAGPMNWKNPVRVVAYIGWEIFNGAAFLVGEWVRYGVRASQIFLAIPPTAILFFGGGWFAVWSFVRRPFPALETVPLLDLLEYHNPNFYSAVVLWYYLSPLVAVMLAGSIFLSVWKIWIEARKRDLLPFGALPAWPLSPEQPGPEIVIGEVHHPVEPKEIFNPEWLTIPERGLYTGIAIFGAVGSGKTSACMHPFAKQLLSWQADDPEKRAAAQMLMTRRNILVSGGTGSGKTTLLNALIELLPVDERIVAIEDALELRIDHSNCIRFEARGLQEGAVTIRDLVRHALRHRPDHIVVGEVRGGEAADLLQALNTGHGGSLTTVHANNAESALSRIASCAMQGGGELPWEVTCRGVVDGIAMVIHMTRREGRRFVEEAAYVKGYEAKENQWEIERLE